MNIDRIIEFSKVEKKKTITQIELKQIYRNEDYTELAVFIDKLVAENRIVPIKKHGTNGMNPPMFMEYRIVKEKEDYSKVIEEIKVLNSNLSIKHYIDKPKEYIKDRDSVQKLNEYFTFHKDKFKFPMSVNERSYDIFGKEKFIRGNRRILKNLEISDEKLNIYETPEPFFYYPKDKEISNILIIENKDTWYTVRKILSEGQSSVLGYKIGLLIYGEGKKIINSIDFLHDEELSFIDNPTIKYWGDIDYTGIDIFCSLQEKIDVEIFMPAYLLMLEMVIDTNKLEIMKDQKERRYTDKFLNSFSDEQREFITEMLNENKYIPQEILNYQELRKDK